MSCEPSDEDVVWGSRKGDLCSEYQWAVGGRAMAPHCPGNRKNHDPPPAQVLCRPPPRLGLSRFAQLAMGCTNPTSNWPHETGEEYRYLSGIPTTRWNPRTVGTIANSAYIVYEDYQGSFYRIHGPCSLDARCG